MTDKTILSTEEVKPKGNKLQSFFANKKIAVPAWLKKVKGKEVAAFAVGLLSYNVFYSLTKDGTPIAKPTDLELEPSAAEAINEKITASGKIATSVGDEMSFGEAFQASRVELGAGNFFWWNGRFYNNYTEQEWESLSAADKAEFAQEAGLLQEEDFDVIVEETDTQIEETLETETITPTPESETSRLTNEEINPTEEYEELEEPPQSMAYVDRDGDGKDDVILINQDNDSKAEIMIDFSGDQPYALVDTGNTGMMDTLYFVNEDGELHSPQELADEIPAPKLPQEQMMDLIGNDGVLDSLAHDDRGNARADRIDVDTNADGVFDTVFWDTNGDGKLDSVCKMDEEGKLSDLVELSEPFDSPEVDALVESFSNQPNTADIEPESEGIAGLDNQTETPLGTEEEDSLEDDGDMPGNDF